MLFFRLCWNSVRNLFLYILYLICDDLRESLLISSGVWKESVFLWTTVHQILLTAVGQPGTWNSQPVPEHVGEG